MYQPQPGYVPYQPPAPRKPLFNGRGVLLTVVLIVLFSGGSFFLGVKVAPLLGNTPVIGNDSIDGYYLYTNNTTVALLHIVSAKQTILGSSYNLQIGEHGEEARADNDTYVCSNLSASTYVANISGSILTWGSTTGTFDGNTITFTLPDNSGSLQNEVFTRSSVDQYNTALQQFKSTYQNALNC